MADPIPAIDPEGDFDLVELDTVAGYRTFAFPTPPISWGTGVDVDTGWVIEGLEPPYYFVNAFHPAGEYLEPNKGQIWPRIG